MSRGGASLLDGLKAVMDLPLADHELDMIRRPLMQRLQEITKEAGVFVSVDEDKIPPRVVIRGDDKVGVDHARLQVRRMVRDGFQKMLREARGIGATQNSGGSREYDPLMAMQAATEQYDRPEDVFGPPTHAPELEPRTRAAIAPPPAAPPAPYVPPASNTPPRMGWNEMVSHNPGFRGDPLWEQGYAAFAPAPPPPIELTDDDPLIQSTLRAIARVPFDPTVRSAMEPGGFVSVSGAGQILRDQPHRPRRLLKFLQMRPDLFEVKPSPTFGNVVRLTAKAEELLGTAAMDDAPPARPAPVPAPVAAPPPAMPPAPPAPVAPPAPPAPPVSTPQPQSVHASEQRNGASAVRAPVNERLAYMGRFATSVWAPQLDLVIRASARAPSEPLVAEQVSSNLEIPLTCIGQILSRDNPAEKPKKLERFLRQFPDVFIVQEDAVGQKRVRLNPEFYPPDMPDMTMLAKHRQHTAAPSTALNDSAADGGGASSAPVVPLQSQAPSAGSASAMAPDGGACAAAAPSAAEPNKRPLARMRLPESDVRGIEAVREALQIAKWDPHVAGQMVQGFKVPLTQLGQILSAQMDPFRPKKLQKFLFRFPDIFVVEQSTIHDVLVYLKDDPHQHQQRQYGGWASAASNSAWEELGVKREPARTRPDAENGDESPQKRRRVESVLETTDPYGVLGLGRKTPLKDFEVRFKLLEDLLTHAANQPEGTRTPVGKYQLLTPEEAVAALARVRWAVEEIRHRKGPGGIDAVEEEEAGEGRA